MVITFFFGVLPLVLRGGEFCIFVDFSCRKLTSCPNMNCWFDSFLGTRDPNEQWERQSQTSPSLEGPMILRLGNNRFKLVRGFNPFFEEYM